jgi:hypothetical protein
MWSILLLASTLACSGGGAPSRGDAAASLDGPAADAPSTTGHDGPSLDAAAVDSPAGDTAADRSVVDQRPTDVAPEVPPAEVGGEAGGEVAADGSPADAAAACSPAPDQHGFYSSCAACPDPSDCDTIDVNGSRRYACGCSRGCPCNTHCGSYVIPGTAVSISGICVR